MPIKVGTTNIKIPFSKAYVGSVLVYSASKKYTWANLIDYCTQIKNSQISGTTYYSRLGAQYLLNNEQNIINSVGASNINNYTDFVIARGYNNANIYFLMSPQHVTVKAVSSTSYNFTVQDFTQAWACSLSNTSISNINTNLANIQQYNINSFTTSIIDSLGLVNGDLLYVEGRGLFNKVSY